MLESLKYIQKEGYQKYTPFIKNYKTRVAPISFALINAVPGFVSGASRALDELCIGIITRNSKSFKNSVIHTISAVVDLIFMPYQGVKSVFAPKKTEIDLKKTMNEIEKYCNHETLLINDNVQNPRTKPRKFNGFNRRIVSPIRGLTSSLSYISKAISMLSLSILSLPILIEVKNVRVAEKTMLKETLKFTAKAIASPFVGIAGIFTSRVHKFLEV